MVFYRRMVIVAKFKIAFGPTTLSTRPDLSSTISVKHNAGAATFAAAQADLNTIGRSYSNFSSLIAFEINSIRHIGRNNFARFHERRVYI